MSLQQKIHAAQLRVRSAIPLSLYRRSMKGIQFENPHLYDDIFAKYGEGPDKKYKQRIYIPLNSSAPIKETRVTPNREVLEYLEANDFKVDNYLLGTVIMPDGKRTTKIGKVLSKEPELKKLFDNDPARATSKRISSEGGLLVVISRHPYDILGISFDRGWTSCTNLRGGANASRLKSSIKFGLLAAYLVKNDDKNINNPIARILIRPYFKKRDAALSLDRLEYGTASSAFRSVVKKFVEWVNSGSPRGLYSAPEGMYLDQENDTIFVGELTDKEFTRLSAEVRMSIARSTEDADIFQAAIRDEDYLVRAELLRNPNVPKEILESAFKGTDIELRELAVEHPSFPTELLVKAFRDESHDVRIASIKNPNLPKELLTKAFLSKYPEVRCLVIGNPNFPQELFEVALRDKDEDVRALAAANHRLPKNLFEVALRDKHWYVRTSAVENPNFPQSLIPIAMKDKHPAVRETVRDAFPEYF